MDYEPISVALKFAFLALLYVFLFWIATSARKDLRRSRETGAAAGPGGFGGSGFETGGAAARDGWLVIERSEDLAPGTRYDLFGGITLGRSAEADISFTDRFASGLHARVYPRGDRYFLEDMNSTNGTLLDGRPVSGEAELADGSRIEIGDTAFRIEIE